MVSQMARGMGNMMIANLGTEILYSFVIILCSLMIYIGTKELYNLSKHRGIKYFRLTFLFFALAYFSRSLIKFMILYTNTSGVLAIPRILVHPLVSKISLFLFIYLSTQAIFFLIYSIKCNEKNRFPFKLSITHIFSILFAGIIISTNNGAYYFYLNIFLFILILFSLLKTNKKSKNKIYGIYILLIFFWILNTVDLLLPSFFKTTQIGIYLASSGIFIFMLYKVLRTLGK
jgi:hypothetical protein